MPLVSVPCAGKRQAGKSTIVFVGVVLLSAAAIMVFWSRSPDFLRFGSAIAVHEDSDTRDQTKVLRKHAGEIGTAQRAGDNRLPSEISLSIVRNALARATDLMKFRDSLTDMPGLTPQDRLYYAAAIDEYCHVAAARAGWSGAAKIYDWGEGNPLEIPNKFGATDKRAPTPQSSDPKKAIREHARKLQEKNSSAALCAGYKTMPASFEDITRRMRAAADLGDARAIAMLADIEFRESAKPIDWSKFTNKSGKPLPNIGTELPDPPPDYRTKIAAAIATRDPSAILSFGQSLGQTYASGEYTFANEALHPGLKLDLWKLIACEFGAPCAADNNRDLLRACAVDGLCELPDLESYFLSYRFSPAEVEQYQRLKPLLVAAIQSGNWSLMQFDATHLPPGAAQITSFKTPLRTPARLGR